MNKLLKITLLVLVLVFGMGGMGLWYVASAINPAQLTQIMSSSVKKSTGRNLKTAGPVSLKLFPSLGLTAEQVSLSNASWASKADLLTVRRVELDIYSVAN